MHCNLITVLHVTAMVVSCAFMIGCARNPQVKDSEGPQGEENITTRKSMETDNPSDIEDTVVIGTFELEELDSVEDFRTYYLREFSLYLGHDADWEYLGGIGSDHVYKITRKKLDRESLRKMQTERSMIKFVAGGPPLDYWRSKEFLDWLEKTKLSKD